MLQRRPTNESPHVDPDCSRSVQSGGCPRRSASCRRQLPLHWDDHSFSLCVRAADGALVHAPHQQPVVPLPSRNMELWNNPECPGCTSRGRTRAAAAPPQLHAARAVHRVHVASGQVAARLTRPRDSRPYGCCINALPGSPHPLLQSSLTALQHTHAALSMITHTLRHLPIFTLCSDCHPALTTSDSSLRTRLHPTPPTPLSSRHGRVCDGPIPPPDCAAEPWA